MPIVKYDYVNDRNYNMIDIAKENYINDSPTLTTKKHSIDNDIINLKDENNNDLIVHTNTTTLVSSAENLLDKN
jgi:hypothetical protein